MTQKKGTKKGTKKEAVPSVPTSTVPSGAVPTPETKSKRKFTVKDVEELKPKALPLVITPEKGEWENEEQAKFARILNGYAYKNPTKWEAKKEVLLDQLADLADNPQNLHKYMGTRAIGENSNLKYKDHRFGEVEGENTGGGVG